MTTDAPATVDMNPGRLARHLDGCNNVTLPGDLLPLSLGDAAIGFVAPALASDRLLDGLITVADGRAAFADPEALGRAARRLADAGRFRWRDEPFDVRDDGTGALVGTLDRGALPAFGIAAAGVHLNGLVARNGETLLWVARRAADKLLDPGKLDHLAAGGVPAGLDPRETLLKEAAEECGLAPSLLRDTRPVATIRYVMSRPEGLRRDTLHCFDVVLPPDWRPEARDGEVEAFELWPLDRVMAAVRDADLFKFNVNLVLIDLFLRRGLVATPEAGLLAAGLRGEWRSLR